MKKESKPSLTPQKVASKTFIYTLEYEFWWEAQFEVDLEKAAVGCMESLNFFGDPITREDNSPHSIVCAFLKLWAPTIIEHSLHVTGDLLIKRLGDEEGILPLDGSQGIKLVHCESWRWEADDFNIKVTEVA